MAAHSAHSYIKNSKERLHNLALQIWQEAEVALQEHESAAILANELRKEGFEVEESIAGMPTAFSATWGQGEPTIGFLGEYDALAGMSQRPIAKREPLEEDAPGHACGHNLLGVGSLMAAIGLKKQMQEEGLSGTIIYFGCPAEENLSGKAFMAKAGVFNNCDICLCWHPGQFNMVWGGSSLANNAANITFRGKTAHAAAAPEQGRSALDAVQLMNMGVEFLREHIPDEARIHYVITEGGGQPNVVPDLATTWYLVRAPKRRQVDDAYRRVLKCASGAAEMTETQWDVQLLKAIYDILPNRTLEDVLWKSMQETGPPKFSNEEYEFARKIAKTFDADQIDRTLEKQDGLSDEKRNKLVDAPLHESINATARSDISGSTDVGDVSWCCPTGQISTACLTVGTPGHSWQYTAQSGMGIGLRGMMNAGKILAEAGYRLLTNQELIDQAWEEFEEKTRGKPYESAMSADQKPAVNQFKNE